MRAIVSLTEWSIGLLFRLLYWRTIGHMIQFFFKWEHFGKIAAERASMARKDFWCSEKKLQFTITYRHLPFFTTFKMPLKVLFLRHCSNHLKIQVINVFRKVDEIA